MRGIDIRALRKQLGWTQIQLMEELGVSSRQTLTNWEHSDEVPRIVELAIRAISEIPACRNKGVIGIQLTDEQKSHLRQVGSKIENDNASGKKA